MGIGPNPQSPWKLKKKFYKLIILFNLIHLLYKYLYFIDKNTKDVY